MYFENLPWEIGSVSIYSASFTNIYTLINYFYLLLFTDRWTNWILYAALWSVGAHRFYLGGTFMKRRFLWLSFHWGLKFTERKLFSVQITQTHAILMSLFSVFDFQYTDGIQRIRSRTNILSVDCIAFFTISIIIQTKFSVNQNQLTVNLHSYKF